MTFAGAPTPASTSPTGSRVVQAVERIEGDERLDGAVAALDGLAQRVVERDRGRALQGAAVGHALHPALTLLPIGCWTSATLLDLIPGRHGTASRRLIATGVVPAAPAAVTGLAEFALLEDERSRRTALVHAVGNTLALVVYTWSWLARRRGRRIAGTISALVGTSIVGATGHLGGHLAYVRGAGQGRRDVPPASSDPLALPETAGGEAATAAAPGEPVI
jgi:uncharacterized membrane protein